MKCLKCTNSNLNEIINSTTYTNKIAEEWLDEKEGDKYICDEQEKDFKELSKYYPTVQVKETVIGKVCLVCNQINIIKKEERYYDDDSVVENEKIIYPSEEMILNYKEEREKVPKEVYNTFIKALKHGIDDKGVELMLLRKTLELLLKDVGLENGSLYEKIKSIKSSLNIIEEGMHKIREAGNKATHEYDINYTDNEIRIMSENIEALIKLFYTL